MPVGHFPVSRVSGGVQQAFTSPIPPSPCSAPHPASRRKGRPFIQSPWAEHADPDTVRAPWGERRLQEAVGATIR